MWRKRGSFEVNILGRKVSLCDALWGSRQGIDGDGEAPTATILGGMGLGVTLQQPHDLTSIALFRRALRNWRNGARIIT